MRREPRKADQLPGSQSRRKTVRGKSRRSKSTPEGIYMVWTTFLKRLRELREAAGLSLADVAERARMDKGFISRLETGHGNPTVATLARYAAVLGVRVVFGVEDEGGTRRR
jgi:ribosome-binding protein aMBF1 (putative translation factor)